MDTNNSKTKIPPLQGTSFEHLDRNIPPLAHTPMYVWHKFWSRKTWNVVAEYIKMYSREGDIVFDPFSGSGITALEALKNKRRTLRDSKIQKYRRFHQWQRAHNSPDGDDDTE